MYFVQQQTTTQNHITIFGMIIMEFKMAKNEQRYIWLFKLLLFSDSLLQVSSTGLPGL